MMGWQVNLRDPTGRLVNARRAPTKQGASEIAQLHCQQRGAQAEVVRMPLAVVKRRYWRDDAGLQWIDY